jgi:hypothetical protein
VPHEVLLLVALVIQELEPDAATTNAHATIVAAGRHVRRRGGGSELDAGGGAAGDEEALGHETLGEAERGVDVALAREADKEDVQQGGRCSAAPSTSMVVCLQSFLAGKIAPMARILAMDESRVDGSS